MATKVKTKPAVRPRPTGMLPHEEVVPFDPGFKFPGANAAITFDAESFQQWVYSVLPLAKELPKSGDIGGGLPVGEFTFYIKRLPLWEYTNTALWLFTTPRMDWRRTQLAIYRRTTKAHVRFSDTVYVPILGTVKEVWMSLTPNEILTQRGQLRRAKGKTAMAGLGLGWAARQVLQKKSVTHLTIFERDQAVIDTFGASLIQDFPDRVTITQGDAYEQDWHQFDVSLWDIWASYGGADCDSRFKKIRDSLRAADKVCYGWGDNIYGDR